MRQLLWLAVIASCAAKAATPVFELRPHVSVRLAEERQLVLSDLVDVMAAQGFCKAELQGLPMGQSPSAGTTRVIRKDEILARAATVAGCTLSWFGPTQVTVRVDGVLADLEPYREQGRALVADAYAARYDAVIVTPVDVGTVPPVVTADASFLVQMPALDRPRRRVCVDLLISQHGKADRIYPMWYSVSAQQDAWVLDAPVAARSSVGEASYHMARVDAALVEGQVLKPVELAPGMVFRTPQTSGHVLTTEDLIKPFDVVAGQTVALRYVEGTLRLETSAQAMQSGSVGSFIAVRNLRSSQTTRGRVTGRDIVEVAP